MMWLVVVNDGQMNEKREKKCHKNRISINRQHLLYMDELHHQQPQQQQRLNRRIEICILGHSRI